TICFAEGHNEYDIENMEYHTHFEGVHTHSHGAEGIGVVLMEKHGMGRLRRALESLGFTSKKGTLAIAGRVPAECAALVEAGPRTMYSPQESRALAEYLARGGAALLMLDIDFQVEPGLAAVLAKAGVRLGEGAVIDPLDHYFTDEQMVAVTRYAPHPVTRGLSLTFYPGARPLELVPAPTITVSPLVSSSAASYVRPVRGGTKSETARDTPPARALGVAAAGTWPQSSSGKPFRLGGGGEGDLPSNSFFPSLSTRPEPRASPAGGGHALDCTRRGGRGRDIPGPASVALRTRETKWVGGDAGAAAGREPGNPPGHRPPVPPCLGTPAGAPAGRGCGHLSVGVRARPTPLLGVRSRHRCPAVRDRV